MPDSALNKPRPLEEGEWGLMREHPSIGERIVASTEGLAHLAPIVRAEHERWDGKGYPDGLRGEGVPLASRIVFACDSYHAMTSDRPYRRAIGARRALEEIEKNAGSQFDPGVVGALIDVVGRAHPRDRRCAAAGPGAPLRTGRALLPIVRSSWAAKGVPEAVERDDPGGARAVRAGGPSSARRRTAEVVPRNGSVSGITARRAPLPYGSCSCSREEKAGGEAAGSAAEKGRPPLPERLLEEANDAVLVTEGGPIDGPGPRVVYANAAFSRATGYSSEEIVGRSPRVLQGPGTDRAKLDGIRAALEAGDPVRTEKTIPTLARSATRASSSASSSSRTGRPGSRRRG